MIELLSRSLYKAYHRAFRDSVSLTQKIQSAISPVFLTLRTQTSSSESHVWEQMNRTHSFKILLIGFIFLIALGLSQSLYVMKWILVGVLIDRFFLTHTNECLIQGIPLTETPSLTHIIEQKQQDLQKLSIQVESLQEELISHKTLITQYEYGKQQLEEEHKQQSEEFRQIKEQSEQLKQHYLQELSQQTQTQSEALQKLQQLWTQTCSHSCSLIEQIQTNVGEVKERFESHSSLNDLNQLFQTLFTNINSHVTMLNEQLQLEARKTQYDESTQAILDTLANTSTQQAEIFRAIQELFCSLQMLMQNYWESNTVQKAHEHSALPSA